ncbi:hypothetical protein BDV98DRAFT_433482 [Pterulicium gracile]|uniref:F-box domain-containing protein n=1 Tax=Pterulicium gracile TaxID=1884261 RepID=A0A5C3QKN9_9AGAR|nr:hypothetical protein BDV98DRAFT_433482 [Pterula gracilis]
MLAELVHLDLHHRCDRGLPRRTIPFICTPKLQKMSLKNSGNILGWEEVRELVKRSGCEIRSMDLTKSWGSLVEHAVDDDYEDEDLEQFDPADIEYPVPEFLSLVSSHLESLLLTEDTSRKNRYARECTSILERIAVQKNDTSSPLFPGLKHLRIDNLQLDPMLLAQIIQSRDAGITNVKRLECVEIQYSKNREVWPFYASALKNTLSLSEVPISCELCFDPKKFWPRSDVEELMSNAYPHS